MGLYLPVTFKVYKDYATRCSSFFEVLMATDAYRRSIIKTLRPPIPDYNLNLKKNQSL